MVKYTEEDYREAFEKWLSENPGKTVNDVPKREVVKISNGKDIRLGILVFNRRQALKNGRLTDEKREYWVEKYRLSIDNQQEKINNEKELELREALEKWLSENLGKTVNDVSATKVITISNGKEINLGSLVLSRKQALKNGTLTDEKREYWVEKYGLSIDNQQEKINNERELECREAFEKWLSENLGKTVNDVSATKVVKISNGKEIKLGSLISDRKKALKKGTLTVEKREYWVEKYGLSIDNQQEKINNEKELELREALEKWLSENPGKTVNDVPNKEVVKISSEKEIKLGNLISHRKHALKNGTLTDEKREYWVEKYRLSIDNQQKKINNDRELELREALEKWLSENPGKTVNNVPIREVVKISNGKEIKLGSLISDRKKNLKKGKLTAEKREYWVGKYGLSIENRLDNKRNEEEFECREAFEKWLSENPGKTVNDVPSGKVIKISNGKNIKLGSLVFNRKQALKNGTLTDEKKLYWVEKYGLTAYKNEAKQEDYLEMFVRDKEKATRVEKCLKDLREKRRSKKKEEWNIDNILKEFDVDLETLEKYLARTRTKETKPRAKVLEYEGKTLRSFCIENGYNYDVVARAIKLHNMCVHDTLEQLINRSITMYNRKGQKAPATWIYEKYGNLVKHVLLYLKLDSASILKDMTNYIMTLEEAVRHDVFKRNIDTNENVWLEELYNYLIEEISDNKEQKQTEEDIADMFVILVQEYKLTKEEYQVLWNVFSKYVETMREYEIVDVGLETNQSKKLEKIREYNLDEYDIEESFFIPLEFDKGVLLGRQSELYKRRQLLKQYIIDWDYYTDIEKEVIKKQNNFTDEELSYIKETREEINEVIEESSKNM